MGELVDIMLREPSQPQKDKIVCDSTYMKYLQKSNSWRQNAEWWLWVAERRGTRRVTVQWIRWHFCRRWRILERGSIDGYTTLWTYLAPVKCTRKNGSAGKLSVMCILSQLKVKDNDPCLLESAKLEEHQSPLTKACGAQMKRPGRHREGVHSSKGLSGPRLRLPVYHFKT